MKKTILLLLMCTANIVSAQFIGSWATHKSLGNDLRARHTAGMASSNGKLYILGGQNGEKDFTEYNPITGELVKLTKLDDGGTSPNINGGNLFTVSGEIYTMQYSTHMYKYNFAQNEWVLHGIVPLDNTDIGNNKDCGFVIGDILYLLSYSGDFYSYNTTTATASNLADYPGAGAFDGVAFSIGDKGYVMRTAGNGNFYEYDPATNAWTQKASEPYGYIYGSVGVSCNGKGYVGSGGYNSIWDGQGYLSQFWYEYDPITNAWTKMQNIRNLPDTATRHKDIVYNASASVIGNDIYLFGGNYSSPGLVRDDIVKYSTISDNWIVQNEEPGANRTEAFGFYTNGKLYVGGGTDGEYLTDFWEYDITLDNWTRKVDLPSGHAQRPTVEINGKGYFVGGFQHDLLPTDANTDPNHLNELWEYDPATNQWTQKSNIPGAKRRNMVALSYNGKLYTGFGENGSFSGDTFYDFYEYNPATDTWTTLAPRPNNISYGNSNRNFVIGDTAYFVVGFGGLLKYSFPNNSWSYSEPQANYFPGENNFNNQAFSRNGKGYSYAGIATYGDALLEFDPTTEVWKPVLNIPASYRSSTIIPTPQGVFFGFGIGMGFNFDQGASYTGGNSNTWSELKINAGVSDKVGTFGSQFSFDGTCGTGYLIPGQVHTVYDADGKLFASTSQGSGGCLEVLSLDTQLPYRTASVDFGNGITDNAMFLNKSISNIDSTNLRLYYTTDELNLFVANFNQTYNANKTLQDIKLIQTASPVIDNDPLNNTNQYLLISPVLQNYGIDKYFEINTDVSNGIYIYGEIYAVLLTGETLGTSTVSEKNIMIYPNPTTGFLNIANGEKLIGKSYSIADTSGRVMAVGILENDSRIDLGKLSRGIYMINIGIDFKDKIIKE